jgi:hypothetical protein
MFEIAGDVDLPVQSESRDVPPVFDHDDPTTTAGPARGTAQ